MGEAPPEGDKNVVSKLDLNNDGYTSKMNGISEGSSGNEGRTQTRRRPFSAVFGKRVRLFFSRWKWRRKTKRGKSLSKPGPVRTLSGACY